MVTAASILTERVDRAKLGTQAERVIQVLSAMPQFASYASAREVAERAGVNVATVVRAAQQLGFGGWADLRQALRAEYLNVLGTGPSDHPSSTDVATRSLQQDARNLSAASAADNIVSIRNVADAIRQARCTVVLASGSGLGPGQILTYLASVFGYDVRLAAGSATEQTVAISHIDERDCVIVINVWRLTRSLRGLTELARKRGATVAVLTDLHSSPLNSHADHVVIAPIEGTGPSPSLTAMTAVVEAILAELERSANKTSARQIELGWDDLGLMDDQL